MDVLFEFFNQLLNPDWIIERGGLYLVLLIIFIETGLFFGFVLPGDPLLFISGVIIAGANESLHPFDVEVFNLMFWIFLFILSTTAGNFVGYWFGYKFRDRLNKKKDRWLLKRKHILSAQEFYEKRGGFAIVIARFLPIVRTFAPIVGGMVRMNFKRFSFFNVLGAIIWATSLTTLGYVLGDHPWTQRNLEWVILGLVLFVTLPVVFKLISRKGQKQEV